ncbi:1-phosphofructokinase [Geosporobacter ferrireducens]|uniref:Tagatose-6-phosphate kinase n=1 Tax=Geosporobacter ferrireducens TaxID=1424294 RepID=A0A1D8GKX9_9FIRM|nr:1-phosphofructokinase [Geosporobacter ferrireducens]AOT71563.1 1-phosphofructokinase [Geosporobacter ferrireducens]MTI57876.1 1-phosphofructokinase [Geosporobacter ferrireducens]
MIITVTLNPALDKTILLDILKVGSVNRVCQVREDAGGKGINVSKMIRNLKGETLATGFLGGQTGARIRTQLEQMEIQHGFIEVEGNTRTNIKVVDTKNKIYTDINEPGAALAENVLIKLENLIFSRVKEEDLIVFSGSIPQNVPKSIYAKWIIKANRIGVKTILDADGEVLRKGVQAGPYMIKPNIYELEMLFDRKIETMKEIVEAAQSLLEYGIKIIAVSMGEQGSVFVTQDKTLVAEAIKTDVKSTVGAGDSVVGALAYAISKKMDLEEGIELAIAAATATIGNEGTEMGTLEQIKNLMKQVKIKSIRC